MAFSDSLRRRFADVVQAHLDDAWRLARRMVGDAEAEDVVQEAALRALKALETQSVASPRAWFLAIVRNAALTALERRGAAGVDPADPDDLEDALMDPSADIEAALIARQESARVLAAVDALPLALRETVTLRDINDLSYREIAEATGAPIGTVMSRLARARAALAKTLGRRP